MDAIKTVNALGLMSGASLLGVDIAVISTDGVDVYDISQSETFPYEDDLREKMRHIFSLDPADEDNFAIFAEVEKEFTEFNARVAKDFIKFSDKTVDVIGFTGHTIRHRPHEHYTYQIGDGQLLAALTGVRVVNNFRRADIFAGGQGGPMYPVYHEALCSDIEKPVVVVNVGGVTGITWLGRNGEMMAFDTGPGNAQINDWVLKRGSQQMDYNGKLAITGTVNEKIVANLMRHKFFAKYPPKAVDRGEFKNKLEHLEGLSLEDGAATVTAFVAESIAYSIGFFVPELPKEVIICGGGAKNPTLVRFLRQRLKDIEVTTGREIGWDTESIEAQACAYLAVRRLFGMPSTFPSTTGAFEPIICGQIHNPE